jgi:predicted Fe-Mo cluster-binding NifX family protein
MLAIPVLRSRVAPVLNWCSRIRIFSEDAAQESVGQELHLPHLEAGQRLQVLREKGVNTLICGALSADLLRYAGDLGLTVVSGVAGEVHEVVQSYWQNTLDHPRFWLPGCRGLRRYRRGWQKGQGLPCNGQSRTRSRSRNRPSSPPLEQGLGPGGFCHCPDCGIKVPHEQGIPCAQIRCPRCSQIMGRV